MNIEGINIVETLISDIELLREGSEWYKDTNSIEATLENLERLKTILKDDSLDKLKDKMNLIISKLENLEKKIS